jgi:pilus assembly protein FimV
MDDAAASTWEFAEPVGTPAVPAADDLGEFNDDPVDTKLDLARAYLDMGDAEGARAMLDEVIKEGSQMQQDVARGLLGGLPH